MFILFGTGKSELKNKYFLKNCACPSCNQQNSLVGTTIARYFHCFFIPFLPAGKTRQVSCMHCNSSFKENTCPPDIRKAFALQALQSPNKTPLWQGCGCLAVLAIMLIIAGVLTFGWFKHRNDPPVAEDYRKVYFRADKRKLTADPSPLNDSISFQLKNCLDDMLTNSLNKNDFRYFSKTHEDRVLVLVEIEDMKKIKTDQRRKLIPLIQQCVSSIDGYSDKELYIGVEGRWNMVLTSSPMRSDLDGNFADEDILYPFYDTAKTITIDSVIIKTKKR